MRSKYILISFLSVGLVLSVVQFSLAANPGHPWSQMDCDTTLCASSTISRVGIGTITPGYKLDISGDVRSTGVSAFGGYTPDSKYGVTTPTFYAGQALIGNATTSGTFTVSTLTTCSNPTTGKLYADASGKLMCGADQGGAVASISNSDSTLTISPTTGAVVASLNLGKANTWTAAQTFSANTNFPVSGVWNTSGNVGIGTTNPGTYKLQVIGGKIYTDTQGTAAGEVITAGRTLTAGNGLTGGGDLTSDKTFNVGAGTGISVAADTVGLTNTGVTAGSYTNTSITVDAQGRITAASTGSASGDMTGVTAGNGLTGGGLSGDVTLNVVGGAGIGVGVDNIALSYPSKSCSGAAISSFDLSNGNAPGCISVGSGDITGVYAGAGLSGGGSSGEVTLSLNYAESDPQVGTVTSGNWCVGNGSQTSCTKSMPFINCATSYTTCAASSANYTTCSMAANCTGGAMMTGGGCKCADDAQVGEVTLTYNYGNGTTWYCACNRGYGTAGTITVTVYTTCCGVYSNNI